MIKLVVITWLLPLLLSFPGCCGGLHWPLSVPPRLQLHPQANLLAALLSGVASLNAAERCTVAVSDAALHIGDGNGDNERCALL